MPWVTLWREAHRTAAEQPERSTEASPVFDVVLTPAERALLVALNAGVRYLIRLPLERVIAIKRAAQRPKDTAQLPMLEATLAALRARGKREGS